MQWAGLSYEMVWLREFEAYSAFHALTLMVCLTCVVVACALGRRSEPSGEHRLRLSIGWSIVIFQIFATLWRFLPGNFELGESLPLHLCRIVVWAAALSLITGSRRAHTICFFWGLGLSTQGFITPMWTHGLASVEFWLFWVSHTQILLAAVYSISVGGYRASRTDLVLASVSGALLAMAVVGINVALGTNYSYLGSGQYNARCVVDMLGPWPWRAPAMIAGAIAIFGILYGVSVGLSMLGRFARRTPELAPERRVA